MGTGKGATHNGKQSNLVTPQIQLVSATLRALGCNFCGRAISSQKRMRFKYCGVCTSNLNSRRTIDKWKMTGTRTHSR